MPPATRRLTIPGETARLRRRAPVRALRRCMDGRQPQVPRRGRRGFGDVLRDDGLAGCAGTLRRVRAARGVPLDRGRGVPALPPAGGCDRVGGSGSAACTSSDVLAAGGLRRSVKRPSMPSRGEPHARRARSRRRSCRGSSIGAAAERVDGGRWRAQIRRHSGPRPSGSRRGESSR